VQVTCGTTVLHRSFSASGNAAVRAADATEIDAKTPGWLQHTLLLEDQGTTGSWGRLFVDTDRGTAVILPDTDPASRIDLRVERLSVDRAGDVLLDPVQRPAYSITAAARTGVVKVVEGSPSAAAGATCTVLLTRERAANQSCRVRVRCGGAELYGAGSGGYAMCTFTGARVQQVTEEQTTKQDGDPAMELDLAANNITVRDTTPAPWKVTIRLDPTP
jgi:hypothetical protein